jgi:dipeptidyl aminopeptidase/acylaminoacyl peptidase
VLGADAAAGKVVASVADPASSGEVVLVGTGQLTSFSSIDALPLHELTAPSGVHGWVVLPEGPGPHPVLLDVHGGPYTQYGWKLYDEAQVLARAGYAVLLCNPRGSAGYGEQHGRAVVGAFGGPDVDDVMAFLDAAVQAFPLDSQRVGVMGGSYGGWMTAWLLATYPDRWAAGIVERGFLDPLTFAGTSDIGWFFGTAYLGADPVAHSPFARVSAVTAPTLVIHSENDLRCPLEQGQRYFAALQEQGTPSAFLVFPGEAHGLTRGGSPRHRRQRFEHVLAWWAEHLPVRTS